MATTLAATPTRKTAQAEVDRWNESLRASGAYQSFMRSIGNDGSGKVKLSRKQQGEFEAYLKAQGVSIPDGMHIDQGGNLNQKNRLARNIAIGAAIGGAAATGFGLAGIGPLAGLAPAAAAPAAATTATTAGAAAAGTTAAATTTGVLASTVPVSTATMSAATAALSSGSIMGASAAGTGLATAAGWSTLTKLAVAGSIASTALDVYGRVKAGNAAKKVGEFNARVAQAQAEDAIQRGAFEEQRFRTQLRVLQGRNRAGYAGQGVKVDTGSPVDVAADIAYLGEIDAQTIRANAAREAWGYQVSAENARMGASIASSEAYFGAAASALSGGGSLALQLYGMREPKSPQTGARG